MVRIIGIGDAKMDKNITDMIAYPGGQAMNIAVNAKLQHIWKSLKKKPADNSADLQMAIRFMLPFYGQSEKFGGTQNEEICKSAGSSDGTHPVRGSDRLRQQAGQCRFRRELQPGTHRGRSTFSGNPAVSGRGSPALRAAVPSAVY